MRATTAKNVPRRSMVPYSRNEAMTNDGADRNETLTVPHYVKNHTGREVPVSRLSPQMAIRLKNQGEIFKRDAAKKITGLCYFCENTKSFDKLGWQR